MAMVRRLKHHRLERVTAHSEAECTYAVVSDETGTKYLQLDTYGSRARKIKDKQSQSIRFSPEAIVQLKTILAHEFS
jgi:hypothetical protein